MGFIHFVPQRFSGTIHRKRKKTSSLIRSVPERRARKHNGPYATLNWNFPFLGAYPSYTLSSSKQAPHFQESIFRWRGLSI
jgi:hypothetical protein